MVQAQLDAGVYANASDGVEDALVLLRAPSMTPDDIRRIALGFPEAVEADHHGMPSFRVGGKIFATLHVAHPRMMARLDPEDQYNLSLAHQGLIEPVPGAWGRGGATFLWYEQADEALARMMLELAWRGRAPRRLVAVGP